MKPSSRFVCARNSILAAGALFSLLALGGCGGGGGGGSLNGVPPVAFTYPSSLDTSSSTDNVNGFIAPYALDPVGNILQSVDTTAFGTSPSPGIITITIGDITLSGTVIEPGFVVTFNPSGMPTPVPDPLQNNNSPLDSLPTLLGSSLPCTGCLKTGTAQAMVNGVATATVTFTYLDPTSPSFPLTFSALGLWTKPTTTGTSPYPEVGGAFSAGVTTRGIDLPTSGSAEYQGYFIGRYVTSGPQTSVGPLTSNHSAGSYIVGANASATADFAAGSVMFSTSQSHIALESGGILQAPVAESRLDLVSTPMPITRTSTSNAFSGTVGTALTGFFPSISGEISGAFYGPPAATTPFAPSEAGGALKVTNSTSTQSMVGSFAVKTPPFK